jgi:hypothetical protein
VWNYLVVDHLKVFPFFGIFPSGVAVGMENWLRITFGIDPSALEDGFGRIKAFCERHAKKQLHGAVVINN